MSLVRVLKNTNPNDDAMVDFKLEIEAKMKKELCVHTAYANPGLKLMVPLVENDENNPGK